jgi:hypothetical protein
MGDVREDRRAEKEVGRKRGWWSEQNVFGE